MAKEKTRHLQSYKALGKNIARIRKTKHMSQEELAFILIPAYVF